MEGTGGQEAEMRGQKWDSSGGKSLQTRWTIGGGEYK